MAVRYTKSSGPESKAPDPPESFGESAPAYDEPGPASEPVTTDPEALRADYETSNRVLWLWLWAGLLPLAAGLWLWLWGPRETRAVPTPTKNYTFHQAGTVRGTGDTTWVWILADTAGRARVLLSADQGYTWQVRDLGLPLSRARAMALGWGRLGKGLVVGDSGHVRLLENAFSRSGKWRDTTISRDPRQSLFSVAVDALGQRAVVLGAVVPVQVTTDSGRSWQIARNRKTLGRDATIPTIVAAGPRGDFRMASATQMHVLNDSFWAGFSRWDSLPPILLSIDAAQRYLVVAADGTALRYYSSYTTASNTDTLRRFHIFEAPQWPAAIVLEQPAYGLDSTLLLINTPQGGQLRRVAISPQLAAADRQQHARRRRNEVADSLKQAAQDRKNQLYRQEAAAY
jgi:hypothetical protein